MKWPWKKKKPVRKAAEKKPPTSTEWEIKQLWEAVDKLSATVGAMRANPPIAQNVQLDRLAAAIEKLHNYQAEIKVALPNPVGVFVQNMPAPSDGTNRIARAVETLVGHAEAFGEKPKRVRNGHGRFA